MVVDVDCGERGKERRRGPMSGCVYSTTLELLYIDLESIISLKTENLKYVVHDCHTWNHDSLVCHEIPNYKL